MSAPQLPADAALLLDLDGTLLDIAPTPDAVVVPAGLLDDLATLRRRLGGALAVISGRPIGQVDALLGDAPRAVAGEHGAAVRHAPQAPICRASLPEIPHSWLEEAGRLAAARPGVLLERKQASFVLHYRLAPAEGPALLAALQALAGEAADRFTVMSAHMAWEVKPRGVDKARAVAALMGRAPFAGRRPVYIGDDVTDEDGMRAARALGGLGWRVQDVFTDAAGVRAWLSRLAGR